MRTISCYVSGLAQVLSISERFVRLPTKKNQQKILSIIKKKKHQCISDKFNKQNHSVSSLTLCFIIDYSGSGEGYEENHLSKNEKKIVF